MGHKGSTGGPMIRVGPRKKVNPTTVTKADKVETYRAIQDVNGNWVKVPETREVAPAYSRQEQERIQRAAARNARKKGIPPSK